MKPTFALRAALGALSALVYLFMLAPVIVIVILAFNASPQNNFPITGLTLHWFHELFQDDAFLSSLKISLLLAVCAATIALTVGTLAAYAMARLRFRGHGLIEMILTLPLVMPHLVLGVALLLAFRLVGIDKSFLLLVLGHVVIILPLIVLTTRHRLQSVPAALEEAAATLGADVMTILRTVTFPLAFPAIVISGIFAFMQSFDEVTATLFWRPPNMETVQTEVMGMLQFDIDPKIYAMAGMLVLFSVTAPALAFGIVHLLSRRSPGHNRIAEPSE